MELFNSGFIIGKIESEIHRYEFGSEWKKKYFGNYILRYHDRLNILYKSINDSAIVFLGTVINVFENQYNDESVCVDLLSFWIKGKEEEFYNKMDCLSGNFIILIIEENNLFVWPDAMGTKAIFYDTVTKDVTSHPQIIAECYGYNHSEEYKQIEKHPKYRDNKNRFLPGLITPFSNILELTPNTMCIMPDARIKRFYPRQNNSYKNKDMSREIQNFFQEQIRVLCENEKIAISITAGLDSRLTLASSRDYRDRIYYYTAEYNDKAKCDAMFAETMLTELGIKHNLIPEVFNVPKVFLDLYHRNSSQMSTDFRGDIAYSLEKYYPKERVHIKSNGSDICRAHSRRRCRCLPEKPTGKTISKLHWKTNDFSKYYQTMLDVTELKNEKIYDYDIYDLAYWESKIGKWQSLCILEWTCVQDTILPYNCRKLLEMMLSTPLEDRKKDVSYAKLASLMWRETSEFPVNEHEKEERKLKTRLKIKLQDFYKNTVVKL